MRRHAALVPPQISLAAAYRRRVNWMKHMSTQAPGPVPKPRKKASKARLWLLLHGWMGLPFWAYLLLICVTGTIATVSDEILWLVDPEVRAHASAAPPLSPDALVAAAIAQQPGSRLAGLQFPEARYLAPKVGLIDAAGVQRAFYLDPGSGRIQGESAGGLAFPEFIRALHGWLLLPWNGHYSWGWYAVTLMALPILGSLVTGILIYKKFWRAYLNPRLRIGKGARTFWGDLHRLAGIWSLPFIGIIGLSGTWFLAQALLADLAGYTTGEPTPSLDPQSLPRIEQRSDLPPVRLDAALAEVHRVAPRLQVESIYMPSDPYSPILFYGRDRVPLAYGQAVVNPYDGHLMRTRTLRDQNAFEIATGALYPLHFGDFMGLGLKLVYFLFGLLLSAMTLSGMLIWTRRTALDKAAPSRPRRAAKEVRA